MTEIKLLAYAKLNLALDIVGQRGDGYHLLDMVNITVDLYDELTISRAKTKGITIKSNARFLPNDERNHVHKAIIALAQYVGIPTPQLDVYINKRIPTQAGLGGGSADAAAALVGVNELLELNLSVEQLCAVGAGVGADVPYCIVGGAARVGGIGEIIERVADNCDYNIVIMMPKGGHSTHEAFAAIDGKSGYARPNIDAALACLANGDVSGLAIQLCNVFETAQHNEQTQTLVSVLLADGALGASMTGSGAAVFGLFKNSLDARKCCRDNRRGSLRVFAARPTQTGSQIVFKK